MADSRRRPDPSYLLLGEVLRPHGILGELRVRLLTDYPERISQLSHVYLGKSPDDRKAVRYPVQHMRMHQDYGLLKLTTIQDRNQAELMRGLFVMVRLQDAIPLEEDEIYLFELIGMAVQTEGGEPLGEIVDVLETGANDVYIVQGDAYGEVLIPVTDETIIETDTDTGIITVHLPEGLLPSK